MKTRSHIIINTIKWVCIYLSLLYMCTVIFSYWIDFQVTWIYNKDKGNLIFLEQQLGTISISNYHMLPNTTARKTGIVFRSIDHERKKIKMWNEVGIDVDIPHPIYDYKHLDMHGPHNSWVWSGATLSLSGWIIVFMLLLIGIITWMWQTCYIKNKENGQEPF